MTISTTLNYLNTQEQTKTKRFYEVTTKMLGQKLADITYIKCLSIASAKLSFPRLNIINAMPSGTGKTLSSEIATAIMPKNWSLPLKSDFTIFGLYEQTKIKEGTASINCKCLMVNDATLWLSAQAPRSKQRSINGIAELMTESLYKYACWNKTFIIKGQITVILNITIDSYNRNLKLLLGDTFDERALTVFAELTKEEFKAINHKESSITLLDIDSHSLYMCIARSSRKVELSIPIEFEPKIELEADQYRYKSLKGYPRTQATVRALLMANAFFNDRVKVCESDFYAVETAKKYLVNPMQKNKPVIIEMLRNKSSVAEICSVLGKDYEKYDSYVYRVLNEAKAKGLLS